MIPILSFLLSMIAVTGRIGDLAHQLLRMLDGPGMMVVALLDSSFLSIPEGNDLLIVGLSIGKAWPRVAYYVSLTTLGSIIGCLLLYTVGRRGGSALAQRRFSAANLKRAERLYAKFGIFALLIPSLLPPPCPFKIFVLSAGVFGVRTPAFLAAVTVGRLIRYSMWGILAYYYGGAVKLFMEDHLTTVGIVLFGVLVIVVAILAGLYWRHLGSEQLSEPES